MFFFYFKNVFVLFNVVFLLLLLLRTLNKLLCVACGLIRVRYTPFIYYIFWTERVFCSSIIDFI